jgi:DNA-binding NarL/FixJ family response regulator
MSINEPAIRILIADDHLIVRTGLKALTGDMPGMSVVGEATTGSEVLQCLRLHLVDIVILDLTMADRSGLDVLLHIKAEYPQVRVLVFSFHAEKRYGRRLLRAGASGYLMKNCAPELFEKALRSIAKGRKFVTPSLAEQLATDLIMCPSGSPHAGLTDHEYEIMLLLAQGFSQQDIARRLMLGASTIRSYRVKMHVGSNAELIQYTIGQELLETPLVSK